MPKGKHSHNPKKWVKTYTPEEIETLRKCFDLSYLQNKPITDVSITYYKYDYTVCGRINQYYFSASNGSEYRTSINYDSTRPFYLSDFDFLEISVWIKDGQGETHEIYSD